MDRLSAPLSATTTPAEIAEYIKLSNSVRDSTILGRLGITITAASHDFMEGEMPVAGNLQPAGLFHGGAHVVLAETLGSSHAFALANADVVGVDLNATHVRGVREGTVHGRAEVIHAGRTMINHEVRMTDDEGRLLSIVRITNLVLKRRRAEARHGGRPDA